MTLTVLVVRRVKAPVGDAWVGRVVTTALRAGRAKRAQEVGVVFTGDAEMKKLNAAHRGMKKTTDVLSFGDEDGPWAGEGSVLGDVIISVPQARRQAEDAGHPLKNEIAMLLVHGCLHLLGHDHAKPAEARRMFGVQQGILKRLGMAHPRAASFLKAAISR